MKINTGLFMRGWKPTKLLRLAVIGAALGSSLFVVAQSGRSAERAPADGLSYVALMRHGDAPGRHEPAGFDLQDCSTQRNLSGELLRDNGINVTKVLASRWCRTRQTAELLNLGPVKDEPAFDNLEFNKKRAADLIDSERELIASWHGPGVLLIVTHSSNIKALTGVDVEQGSIVVANPFQTVSVSPRFSKVVLRKAY
jgi:phosphohistidine phosphatase SixA